MSMIYGEFQAAARGPAETVRQLPELAKSWPHGGKGGTGESTVKSLLCSLERPVETIRDAEGTVVISWRDSTDKASLYMDLLEHIAGKAPGLDIAVGVKTSNSVSGGAVYSAYYSRAGENTLHPDDFFNSCDVDLEDALPHLVTTDRAGRKVDLSLLDHYGDWYDEDLLFDPMRLAVVMQEGSRLFRRSRDGEWAELLWCEGDSARGDLESMFCAYNEYSRERCGNGVLKCTGEELLDFVQACAPGETLHMEIKDGRPFIWDDSGNEYFPAGVMEVVEHGDELTVYWNFPDEEEDPWIPFA